MLPLLIAPLTTLIERLFPDKEKQNEAKAEMMKLMSDAAAKEMESKSKVIVAEAQGESSAQRNWRPHLMYVFMFILIFNYIITPLTNMFGVVVPALPLPPEMWTLLTVGVGGYIGSRGFEKVTRIKSHKDIFEELRQYKGYLSQEDVEKINSIIEK